MSTPTITNPATGERITFRDRTDSALRFDYALEPGGYAVGKVDHVHPEQAERIEVTAGRLGVRIEGDEWTATPGTRFAVPSGTAHTIWNDGDEPVRTAIELRPALETHRLFETLFGLAREGETNDWGLPGPLQLAVIADAYREEFALARVPLALQRGLATVTAPMGRLAGYRAHYDRFAVDGVNTSRKRTETDPRR